VLQAECDDLDMTGLAHLYSALSAERVAPGHNGCPHASDLIRVKALEGRMCHQIRDATVGPFLSISSIQLADLGGNRSFLLLTVSDPFLILPGDYFYSIMLRRRAFRNCVLVPKRSERSALAYWQVRLSERYNAGAEPQP
jgi:hypothetical protein